MTLSVVRRETQVFQQAGVLTGATAVFTIPTDDAAHIDQLMRIMARVYLTAPAAGHLSDEAALLAELVAVNKNSAVTASVPIATSANPVNSNTAGFFLTSRPETRSAGVNTSTAVWTIAANVATLTVTNSASAGGVTADVTAIVDVERVGST